MGCYAILGLCGYIAFGSTAQDNILMNFSVDDAWANLGRVFMCATLLVAIPLSVFSTRSTLTEFMSNACSYSSSLKLNRAYSYALDLDAQDKLCLTPSNPKFGDSDLEAVLLKTDNTDIEDEEQELDNGTWLVHIVTTAGILLVSMGLAFILPSVSFLLGKVGGIAGVAQMYALPGVVLIRCPELRPPVQRACVLAGFTS